MMNKSDRLMMATTAAQLRNMHDAMAKILDASRGSSSLAELRQQIDQIADQAQRVDMLHDEAYRLRLAALQAQARDDE